jgi:hypothetical protein
VRFGALIPATLAVVTLGAVGCSEGAPRAYAEADLVAIVRGPPDAPKGAPMVADKSGPSPSAEVAKSLNLDPSLLRTWGFVAARDAFFDGPEETFLGDLGDPDDAGESAILFEEEAGAKEFIRHLRDKLKKTRSVRLVEARGLGADGVGFAPVGRKDRYYVWRRRNLVLLAGSAERHGPKAFAERMDGRAAAIG